MSIRRPLVFLSAALLTACMAPLDVPECTPTPSSQASVSGDTITTTTSLRYIDGNAGAGPLVEWCTNVTLDYEAFLLDGTSFDRSRDTGVPLVFAPGLGSLIDGIEQGVIGMRVGSTRRLIIPPALAFGSEPRRDANGQVVVPANSTVVYDIEVLQVRR